MPIYEYKVVPAPEKARKVKGLKGPALFANALQDLMNELGAEGWSYLRADTLPHEERTGLTSKTVSYRNMLIFQREITDSKVDSTTTTAPLLAAALAPEPQADPQTEAEPAETETTAPQTTTEAPLLRALRATPEAEAPEADLDAAPEDDSTRPLFPNRKGQRVDL